jgi:hypothetical protein
MHARDRWRDQRRDFARRTGRLVAEMTSTKGGGALRWKPLVLWVWRCSDSLAYLMCHIAWHESSGSPFRWNTAGSGAFGIWQLLPKPPTVWGPMSQAKAALRKYRDAQRWWGNGLLPWAGCRAFSCPGGCGIY